VFRRVAPPCSDRRFAQQQQAPQPIKPREKPKEEKAAGSRKKKLFRARHHSLKIGGQEIKLHRDGPAPFY